MSDYDIDEEWAREIAEEEADRQRKAEPAPSISRDEFLAWRSPRQAATQALRLDNPLWHWLVRTRWSAYNANDIFAGPSSCDTGPMWYFDRFGKSETPLPDGRVVHIGGEHEDDYDPDFFIYNDVIVTGADGGIAIYGYPTEVFPPTDFHSATLANGSIFIIGCLGHPDQRVPHTTPVYRLALDSMSISQVETNGKSPGWIYKHAARLSDDGQSIIVSAGERLLGNDRPTIENTDSWSLNTLTGEWRHLTRRRWQQWTIRRIDRKRSRLWDVRQLLWHRNRPHLGLESHWRYDDEPDFSALAMLYRLDETASMPVEGPDYNVFSTIVDGLTVRFREDRGWVEAIVEGRLPEERLRQLQHQTLALVERLEASACELEEINDDSL
jgi:hypothetical protein